MKITIDNTKHIKSIQMHFQQCIFQKMHRCWVPQASPDSFRINKLICLRENTPDASTLTLHALNQLNMPTNINIFFRTQFDRHDWIRIWIRIYTIVGGVVRRIPLPQRRPSEQCSVSALVAYKLVRRKCLCLRRRSSEPCSVSAGGLSQPDRCRQCPTVCCLGRRHSEPCSVSANFQ